MPVNLKALIEMAPFVASGEFDGNTLSDRLCLTEAEMLFFAEVVKAEVDKTKPFPQLNLLSKIE